MISTMARDYFQEGIDLFNQGRFFECHEAWEQVWNRSRGEEKLAIQGLIQAAVAILHLERGNREGAKSLYAKARAKLDPLPFNFKGIELSQLREELREFFALAFDSQADALPRRPRLRRRATSIK
jgi:predicted metal-dependent hydrolase